MEFYSSIKGKKLPVHATTWKVLKDIMLCKRSHGKECIWFHFYEIPENIKVIYNDQEQTSGCLRLRVGKRKTTFWKLECKPALLLANHVLPFGNLNLRRWCGDGRVVENLVTPLMACWQHLSPGKWCQVSIISWQFL